MKFQIAMDDLLKIAEEFLWMVSGELDPYTTQKGEVVVEQNRVTLFTPAHIQFARYGRGPGKMPPLDPIIAWVKKKGIISGDDVRGAAFAIAKSIAKKGTLNYTPGAPNALESALNKYAQQYADQLSDKILVSIDDQIKEINFLPEEIIYEI